MKQIASLHMRRGPSHRIPVSRFGVLTVALQSGHHGYGSVDGQTGSIADRVYLRLDLALDVAAVCAERGWVTPSMTPSAEALGLRCPSPAQEAS